MNSLEVLNIIIELEYNMNIIGGLGYNLGFLYDDLKIKEFPRDLNVFKISSTSQTNHHIITNCEILLPEKIGASQEE